VQALKPATAAAGQPKTLRAESEPVLLPGGTADPPIKQDDKLKAHTDNWRA
jgi:hypothetical protein